MHNQPEPDCWLIIKTDSRAVSRCSAVPLPASLSFRLTAVAVFITVRACRQYSSTLPHQVPKARPVVGGLEMNMLGKVATEGEQARPLPELEHPIQVELLANFL